MNWQSRFLQALMARLHFAATVFRPGAKASAPRHTAPGFGTLVIGNSSRDWPGGR